MPAIAPRPSIISPEALPRTGGIPSSAPRFSSIRADQFIAQQPRVLVVFNALAGGVNPQTIDAVQQELARYPQRVRGQVMFFMAHDTAMLKQVLAEQHESLDRVIAAGGDGTITQVTGAAMSYPHLKIGILPLGTGNQMAANLGIPLDIAGALKTALEGTPKPLDVGRFNGHCFTLMAGVGLDAHVVERSNSSAWAKRKLGKLIYYWHGLKGMLDVPIVTYHIEADGVKLTRKGVGVLVANGGKLVGDYTPVPGASTDDGLFDVAVLAMRNRLDYLKGVCQLLTGRVGSIQDNTGILHLKAKNIRITSEPPVKAQVDGDVVGKTPVDIHYEGQVQVLVPESTP